MPTGDSYWKRAARRLTRRGMLRGAALGSIGLAAARMTGSERVGAAPVVETSAAAMQHAGQPGTFAEMLARTSDAAAAGVVEQAQTPALHWPAEAPRPGGPAINVFPPGDRREMMIDASWIERTQQKYGADDTMGALNLITPQKTMRAVQLIKSGRVLDLRVNFRHGHPALSTERQFLYNMSARVDPAAIDAAMKNPAGTSLIAGLEGRIMYMGDGANGHLDGLSHIGMGDVFYNGNRASQFATDTGVTKFGIDKVPPIVTRGVLLDVAKVKGVDILPDTYTITADDLEAARQQAGVTIEPGDAILMHTGWMEIYLSEPARFWKTEPGLGRGAGEWIVDRDPAVIGADNWGVDVVPAEDPVAPFPLHQLHITMHGIYHMDGFRTQPLVDAGVSEFLLVVTTLKMEKAVLGPMTAVAII